MIYFGYGSNLNSASLRAKGVEPLASEPGILRGWKLAFSVTPPFPSQGGMATIMQSNVMAHIGLAPKVESGAISHMFEMIGAAMDAR